MTFLLLTLLMTAGGPGTPAPLPGDAEFALLEYDRAAASYDSAMAAASDSAQYLWRLARLYVCTGDMAGHDQKEEIYRKAVGYAERCIRTDSLVAQGHTWKAAALGNIAMFEGSKGKVRLCNEIKNELDRALALDSLDDVAYSILGSFYLALGKVGWIERQLAAVFLGSLPEGGFDEAESALRRAIAIAPGIVRHRFELGLVLKEEGRKEEAIAAFRAAAALPTTVASDPRTKGIAQKLAKELEQE
ncbi:MAG TPA: tetratricopeptide repeat protein [Bacteroidota bacterium]|nr:tetratricopeptide repeat protein [Bacteroidota bacterium]